MEMMKERAEKEKKEVEEKLLAMTRERDRLQKRFDEEKRMQYYLGNMFQHRN